ncbi:MAG: hypothetical protein JW800_06545 [Candidatus Omnitrophica bacterium]|nr:hypothetical protein [Candidatus Omnitrophota bacterium]
MSVFLKKIVFASVLVVVCFELSGCGETVQGIRKDAQRMGKGVRTIFIRDSN